MSKSLVHWKNKNAAAILPSAIELFGNPTTLSVKKGGLAMWLRSDMKDKKIFGLPNCFEETLLRDESIPHHCPVPHHDFFYSYLKIYIPPNRLLDVLTLSESVSYDPLKHLLSARCGGLSANISTLKIATDIVLDKEVKIKFPSDKKEYKYKGIKQIKEKFIYGKTIANAEDKFLEMLYKDLYDNYQIIKKKFKGTETYYPGIFNPTNCGLPKEYIRSNTI